MCNDTLGTTLFSAGHTQVCRRGWHEARNPAEVEAEVERRIVEGLHFGPGFVGMMDTYIADLMRWLPPSRSARLFAEWREAVGNTYGADVRAGLESLHPTIAQ